MNGQRVFITGATGMLGAALTARVLEEGGRPRLLVRGDQLHPLIDSSRVEVYRGDLSNEVHLARGMAGCELVFHAAGVISYRRADNDLMYRTNVLGTRNVLRAARRAKVKRVVYTSSTAAVGLSHGPDEILDEGAPFPVSLRWIGYMWTKHLAEIEVREAVEGGQNVVMVNPATIFGVGDVRRNTGSLIHRLRESQLRAAPAGGNAVVTVMDVVEGHMLAAQEGEPGRRYILSAENLTYRELFRRITSCVEGKPVDRVIPRALEPALRVAARTAAWWKPSSEFTAEIVYISFRHRWFDASRAQAELGWRPRHSLEDALSDAVAFYEAHPLQN